MDDKILHIFRTSKGEFISGEELSDVLKISRSAIWKHIEQLRAEGYNIIAQPHLGYKLISAPDKLIAEELSYELGTKSIGKKIYSYETTDSTMDIAHRLAQTGSPEGTAVFSEGQSKGRGRLGREWLSPKGKGIYLSLILRPKILPTEAPKVTLMSAVAVAKAIRKVTGLPALIRWPNDILIEGRKVCGILTEMSAEVNTIKYLILGIGINVNTSKEALPKGAASLKCELGDAVSRVELAKELLRQIEEQYFLLREEGFGEIVSEWRNLSSMLGNRVRIVCQDKRLEGYAVDLDLSGALVIRHDSGFTEKVFAGDVILVR
ncbi:MAG: biotin--[acetyl-CoA-carboxylase] ligase [Candidatus Omnitrophota bacterium]